MSAASDNVVRVGNLRRLRKATMATGLSPALIARESIDVRLVKGDRTRRYWIRPGRAQDEWFCQVWFSDTLQHRGDSVIGWQAMHRLKAQYLREIAELERDGWSRTGVDAIGAP